MRVGDRAQPNGYSIIEVFAAILVLGSVISVAVNLIEDPRETTKKYKLESDVRALNAAVAVYRVFGGSLDSVTDPQDILDKLKTIGDLDTLRQMAGLTGTMIDRRLMAEMQTDAEAAALGPRAVWDPTAHRFILAYSGAKGVKSFVLDEAAALETVVGENRAELMRLALSDSWIWDYSEGLLGNGAAPTTVITVDPDDEGTTTPPLPPTSGPLLPPLFTKITGSYPITSFNLLLDFIDPNPPGMSQVRYSINSSVWTVYTGVPVSVPADAVVRAFAESIDVAWTDSVEAMHTYNAFTVQLAKPVIVADASKFDFAVNDINVDVINPNSGSISYLEYRLDPAAAWSAYTGGLKLKPLDYTLGVTVEARVVPTAAYYAESAPGTLFLEGPDGISLTVPEISFSDTNFSGTISSITVTITESNPSGSADIYYQILPAGAGVATGFSEYSNPFAVNEVDYPDGFSIRAYSKAAVAPYIDSDYNVQSTGSYFGTDLNTGGMVGRIYDLKRYADGSSTFMETQGDDPYNQVFYDAIKAMTPEITAGTVWGLDPLYLRQYYSAAKALYGSRFSTPQLTSSGNPELMGVESVVSPNYLVMHYAGDFSPQNPGFYRFSGRADAVLQVWIDGRLVLTANQAADEVASDFPWTDKPDWESYFAADDDNNWGNAPDNLKYTPVAGPWVYLEGEHRIDIVVGEETGDFHMNLRVEEQGVTYADGAQVFTTRPLDTAEESQVSASFSWSTPGTSAPPAFQLR